MMNDLTNDKDDCDVLERRFSYWKTRYEAPDLEELELKVEGSFLGSTSTPPRVTVDEDVWADEYD